MNVANKPDTKNARQRTPPSELILVWSHVTSVFQGLCLSRSMGRVGENPGNEVVQLSGIAEWTLTLFPAPEVYSLIFFFAQDKKIQLTPDHSNPRLLKPDANSNQN